MQKIFTCTICQKKFEEQYFDEKQEKCILHCEKQENDWYIASPSGEKDWDKKKIDIFWKYIQKKLDKSYKDRNIGEPYIDIIFPTFRYEQSEDDSATNFYPINTPKAIKIIDERSIKFINCTFLDFANFKKYHFKQEIVFENCKFENGIALSSINECKVKFNNCNFSQPILESSIEFDNCKDIDFSESEFHKEFIFKNCYVCGKANFYNTKFKGFADFTGTKFKNAHFENTHFEDIAVFAEATFESDLDFKNTKFTDKAIFREATLIGKLNLRETVFKDEADFLDINSHQDSKRMISVANRETARIIKNFHDKANNIIEANKFYALEMQEYEKELNLLKSPLDWIVFKIHALTSNHSQNWILPLFWIIFLTFVYLIIDNLYNELLHIINLNIYLETNIQDKKFINLVVSNNEVKLYENIPPFLKVIIILFLISIPVIIINKLKSEILKLTSYLLVFTLLFYILSNLFINDWELKKFCETINFFKFDNKNNSFLYLIYKIAISYLIYQLIVSIRQHTRRK